MIQHLDGKQRLVVAVGAGVAFARNVRRGEVATTPGSIQARRRHPNATRARAHAAPARARRAEIRETSDAGRRCRALRRSRGRARFHAGSLRRDPHRPPPRAIRARIFRAGFAPRPPVWADPRWSLIGRSVLASAACAAFSLRHDPNVCLGSAPVRPRPRATASRPHHRKPVLRYFLLKPTSVKIDREARGHRADVIHPPFSRLVEPNPFSGNGLGILIDQLRAPPGSRAVRR